MRSLILILAGVLAGCVADAERLDTGDAMGAESGAATRYTECEARARQAADERNLLIGLALCWIEENSEYGRLPPPAHWVELSTEEMTALAQRRLNRKAGAMYFCGEKTFYMNKDWDWRDLGVRSVLLHELVHHAQCFAGRPAQYANDSCVNEREAHALQGKFLRQMADRLPTARERALYRENAERTIKRGDEVCYALGIR